MLTPVPPIACLRAREAVSARLDGELCELDVVRLEQHLGGCSACARFAAEAAGLVRELRTAALVPAPAAPFVPRERYRVRVSFAAAAAVMLVSAASGSLFLVGRLVGSTSSGSQPPPAVTALRQPGGVEIGNIAMLRNAEPRSRHHGLVPV